MAQNKNPSIHTNLPSPLSSYIGHAADILEVQQRLTANRLVTLTGPGGCGKTRLALRIAGDLTAAYPDGVWLIEFAPLSDAAFITQVVASALGVRERSYAGLPQTVVDYLALRRTLLVFDNCEHLIADISRLSDFLLRSCPNLTILATSREALGISGEAIWEVPPLSLPDPQPWTDPDSVQDTVDHYLKSESVQLFLARVSAISPGFSLSVENGAWVAEICRRLDGMPLAIELAAARVRALSVKQIAERLDDRFSLLSGGNRTAPLRQQTLAAALDWSYELLTDAECRVLQRLSVFAGGIALEAAEAVCACECVRPDEVLEVISRLVDKSLVIADQGAQVARYRLLETIRQYALQKLIQVGDEQASRGSHLDYFMHWAETAVPTIYGPDPGIELGQFELEHDNLRAALDWCNLHASAAHAGLRLAVACGVFWAAHSYFSEGRQRLSKALSLPQAGDRSVAYAQALTQAAQIAYLQADYPAGEPLIEAVLPIWRELGQAGQAGLARALEIYGGFRMEVGDYENAVGLFQESLARYAHLQDSGWMGELHKDLGWCAMRTGDYPLAQVHLEQALALSRESGNQNGLIFACSGLGEVAVRLGQYPKASRLLKQGLSLSRQRGDKWLEAALLGSLGWLALRQRHFSAMRQRLGESLSLRIEIGDKGGTAWCLEKLAEAAFIEGRYPQAVRIFAAAVALRIPVHSVIDPVDQPAVDRMLAALQSRLDPASYQACWEAGQGMPLRDAVRCALDAPAQGGERFVSEKEKYQGLSRRERETAGWVAQGKSNREIAQIMTVGEKTVETYVTRILNKLGFDSRVQVAVWAVEKGLVPPQNS
jgi:predicted ATPase/DNA-binding CsgD family transcriptional regulator